MAEVYCASTPSRGLIRSLEDHIKGYGEPDGLLQLRTERLPGHAATLAIHVGHFAGNLTPFSDTLVVRERSDEAVKGLIARCYELESV